jgi:hypothetical protein
MKVFVAGATGVLGRELVPRLVARGHEVAGMTRSASKRDLVRSLGARPVVADALDPDAVAQAVASAEPEVMVHQLTALSGEFDMRGRAWTDDDLSNWRDRVFKRTASAIGLMGTVRPYDLRHAAASLWLHEGRSVVQVAEWLGHLPTETLKTYSHVVADLSDRPSLSVDEAIREARERASVPTSFPLAAGVAGD